MCKDGTTPFMTDDNNPCLPAPPLSAPLSDPRATATSPHALRSFLLAIVLPAHPCGSRSKRSWPFGAVPAAAQLLFRGAVSSLPRGFQIRRITAFPCPFHCLSLAFHCLSTAFPWHSTALPLRLPPGFQVPPRGLLRGAACGPGGWQRRRQSASLHTL